MSGGNVSYSNFHRALVTMILKSSVVFEAPPLNSFQSTMMVRANFCSENASIQSGGALRGRSVHRLTVGVPLGHAARRDARRGHPAGHRRDVLPTPNKPA